jgi:general secretion pathway protein J
MTPGRSSNAAGFTLIEVLVALAVLGLLGVLVFSGSRIAGKTWSRVTEQTVASADIRAVHDVLRQAISSAYPNPLLGGPTNNRIAFEGESEQISLIAPLPAAIASGVRATMRFSVIAGARSRALVMDWRFDLPGVDGGGLPPEQRVVLLEDVTMVRFSYFGSADGVGAPQWLDRWSGRARLPGLVRVHIVRHGPGSEEWPDLVAEPKITMDTGCVYDAATAGCRGASR